MQDEPVAMPAAHPCAPADGRSRLRVCEPAGERLFSDSVTLGGEGAEVVVPGAAPGGALRIGHRPGVWSVQSLGGTPVLLDGSELHGSRDLRPGDALRVGDARELDQLRDF